MAAVQTSEMVTTSVSQYTLDVCLDFGCVKDCSD